jgi:putative toxin-antitoxin system antitoxin component (TIGR02293 family)
VRFRKNVCIFGTNSCFMKTNKKTGEYIYPEDTIDTVGEAETEYIVSKKIYNPMPLAETPIDLFKKSMGIQLDINIDLNALALIKTGISKKTLNKLMVAMGCSLEEIAAILHTTDRTLRRYTDATILNAEQSERILELIKLYSYGIEVFGSLQKLNFWMNDPVLALNNHPPKQYLDSSIGIHMLMQLLGRLQYGVYS